jgi:hypothetical protein
MISPYKLSATRAIVDCQFPIVDLRTYWPLTIGNWQLKTGNASQVADGLPSAISVCPSLNEERRD